MIPFQDSKHMNNREIKRMHAVLDIAKPHGCMQVSLTCLSMTPINTFTTANAWHPRVFTFQSTSPQSRILQKISNRIYRMYRERNAARHRKTKDLLLYCVDLGLNIKTQILLSDWTWYKKTFAASQLGHPFLPACYRLEKEEPLKRTSNEHGRGVDWLRDWKDQFWEYQELESSAWAWWNRNINLAQQLVLLFSYP